MFRMVRVFGIVMYVVHIFTCGYWLIKLISNKDEEMVDWYVCVHACMQLRLYLSMQCVFA